MAKKMPGKGGGANCEPWKYERKVLTFKTIICQIFVLQYKVAINSLLSSYNNKCMCMLPVLLKWFVDTI